MSASNSMPSAELLAFGLAFVIQGAGIVWWASAVNSSVKATRELVNNLKTSFDKHVKEDGDAFTDAGLLSARLDERSAHIKDTVGKIAEKLGVVG